MTPKQLASFERKSNMLKKKHLAQNIRTKQAIAKAMHREIETLKKQKEEHVTLYLRFCHKAGVEPEVGVTVEIEDVERL